MLIYHWVYTYCYIYDVKDAADVILLSLLHLQLFTRIFLSAINSMLIAHLCKVWSQQVAFLAVCATFTFLLTPQDFLE